MKNLNKMKAKIKFVKNKWGWIFVGLIMGAIAGAILAIVLIVLAEVLGFAGCIVTCDGSCEIPLIYQCYDFFENTAVDFYLPVAIVCMIAGSVLGLVLGIAMAISAINEEREAYREAVREADAAAKQSKDITEKMADDVNVNGENAYVTESAKKNIAEATVVLGTLREAKEKTEKWALEIKKTWTKKLSQSMTEKTAGFLDKVKRMATDIENLLKKAEDEENERSLSIKEVDDAAKSAMEIFEAESARIKESGANINVPETAKKAVEKAALELNNLQMLAEETLKWTVEAAKTTSIQEAQSIAKNAADSLAKTIYLDVSIQNLIVMAEREKTEYLQAIETVTKAAEETNKEMNDMLFYARETKKRTFVSAEAKAMLETADVVAKNAAELTKEFIAIADKAKLTKSLEEAKFRASDAESLNVALKAISAAKATYKTAKKLELAVQGDSTAQFEIGFSYLSGDDYFSADIEKAKMLLTKSAEQGHPKAQFHLGNIYNKEGMFEDAAKWYEKAARQKEERAMLRFALMNETKQYAGHNIDTAVEYYSELVSAPYYNKDAMINLGILYCYGEHIKRDAQKGKHLIETSKPFIDVDAYDCYRLGVLYCTGKINVSNAPNLEDLKTGIKLLDIAIKDGLAAYDPGNIAIATEIRETATGIMNSIIKDLQEREREAARAQKQAKKAERIQEIKSEIKWAMIRLQSLRGTQDVFAQNGLRGWESQATRDEISEYEEKLAKLQKELQNLQ